MSNEKINSKIKLFNNSSLVILIFVIFKFRNIGRSTFRRSKFWPTPHNSSRTAKIITRYPNKHFYFLSLTSPIKKSFSLQKKLKKYKNREIIFSTYKVFLPLRHLSNFPRQIFPIFFLLHKTTGLKRFIVKV